jgi:methylmalonyl-CoA mutase cobalamin-binding domain/chain
MQISPEYQILINAIESGDSQTGVAEAKKLNDAGHKIEDIFEKAIVPCLQDIGDRFSRLELFLPEMMEAADVVKAIHKEMEGRLAAGEKVASSGKVVIGTVFGDIHDIGKNIVSSMLEVNGFEVHDLGINVSAQDFIRRARETDADIIAMSSLLTTSIPYMSDLIELLRSNENDRKRFQVLVGGGPMTPEAASKIGADGFGKDASDAVKQARSLVRNQ